MATECYSLPNTLKMKELPVVSIKLNAPPLNRIIEAILPELLDNFENVSAEVVQCPDLTKPPFNLASEGLSGDENVFDIGDIVNIVPAIKRDKLYDLKDLQKIARSDPLIIMGPCSGPYPFIGADSECVVNVKMTGDCNNNEVKNNTHILTINDTTGECIHSVLPDDETRFSMMANLFTSNGQKGEVLKVVCEIRKGDLCFTMCIRKALAKHFGDDIIAMGGVVIMENGKVRVHLIRPDLAKKPIESNQDMSNLLRFFELSPPLVGLGCIVSHDPGLNLRLEHFHLYNDCGLGGHYYYDTEPDTIKYTGYFSIAKRLTKIDQTQ